MTISSPKISIIVPVYKVEKYLKQCIDSLLCQSMTEIEIILVDDGSPDRCSTICDEYAKKDARVRVIHQDNQGLSVARNVGINVANSDYIMFVDSDDWVEPDFCQIPYNLAINNRADMVIFRFRVRGGKMNKLCIEQKPGIISQEQALGFIYSGGGIAVWNKLYHKKLFRNNMFISGKNFEDQPFTIEAVHMAENIFYTDQPLYNYRMRKGSITNLRTKNSQKDLVELARCTAMRLEELGYINESKKVYLEFCWEYRTRFGMTGPYANECNQELLALNVPPEWFGWRAKMMLRLLQISPRLFDTVCILLGRRIKEGWLI